MRAVVRLCGRACVRAVPAQNPSFDYAAAAFRAEMLDLAPILESMKQGNWTNDA